MTWNGTSTDTGWANITLLAAGGSGTCRWRYLNGSVEVEVNVTGAAIPIGSTPTVIVAAGGIPTGKRPANGRWDYAHQGGNASGFGVVNTDGSIAIGAEAAASVTRTIVRFSTNYIPN